MGEDLGGKQPSRESLPDCSSLSRPLTVALLQQISTGRDKAVLRIDRSFVASQCDLSIDHVLNRGDSAQNGNCSSYPTKQV